MSAIEDANIANETAQITNTLSNGTSAVITVTTIDNDILQPLLSRTTATVEEGTSATYTVSLSAQPATDTTLTITSSDSSAVTTSVASLTFTS